MANGLKTRMLRQHGDERLRPPVRFGAPAPARAAEPVPSSRAARRAAERAARRDAARDASGPADVDAFLASLDGLAEIVRPRLADAYAAAGRPGGFSLHEVYALAAARWGVPIRRPFGACFAPSSAEGASA